MNSARISFASLTLLVLFAGLLYQSNARRIQLTTNFVLDYTVENNRTITFTLEATNVTGWVAIGVNNMSGNMAGADLCLGGYNGTNMQAYAADYHVVLSGSRLPVRDTAQNWDLVSGTEISNKTKLVVSRPLISPDKTHDIDIQNKTMWVIYAYNSQNDTVNQRHDVRGSIYVNLVDGSAPVTPPVTTTPRTTTSTKKSGAGLPTSGIYAILTSLALVGLLQHKMKN